MNSLAEGVASRTGGLVPKRCSLDDAYEFGLEMVCLMNSVDWFVVPEFVSWVNHQKQSLGQFNESAAAVGRPADLFRI